MRRFGPVGTSTHVLDADMTTAGHPLDIKEFPSGAGGARTRDDQIMSSLIVISQGFGSVQS